MFCKKCGAENVDGAMFCKSCGAQLSQEASPSSATPASATSRKTNAVKPVVRGTSNVPLILGVIGGVIGLPSSICSGTCGAAVDAGDFYLYSTGILSIAIIVISCMTKKAPKKTGIVLLILSGLNLILFGCTFNLLGIIATVLSVLAGIFSLTQKTEPV